MPALVQMPQSQVVRLIGQADQREFTLLLGAGASKSSGVPLASEMIHEWRDMTYEDAGSPAGGVAAWCAQQTWFNQDDEYSTLFEMLFPDQRARQKYIEPKMDGAFPSWGYLYLANIVQRGYFNVIFTTNFDDLVNDALTLYLGYNPVVCAADSEVITISLSTNRAKIIKLHGDYLFKRLKNTTAELNQLDPNMESKFKEFAKQSGMVVLGYAGRDQSVMRVFEELLKDDQAFPNGIYWGVRPGSAVPTRVVNLAAGYAKRFHLFECADYDMFMARLHTALKLNLPRTIVQPYESLRDRFNRLTSRAVDDQTIQDHIAQLREQLGRPWAQTTDLAALDLLQAQMALGRRDYKSAIESVTKYLAQKHEDAAALTTWGDALALQAEEEDAGAAFVEAANKWQLAIAADPQALLPRYSLIRYYARKQKYAEGIAAGEALLKLVPTDQLLRRNLVSFYSSNGRHDQALHQVDWLIAREPNDAELHAIRASILEQKGLRNDALDEIRQAVKLNPQNAALHFGLANQLASFGNLEQAADEFDQAIRLDPQNLSYRFQVANFYWSRQQPVAALSHLEAAVAIEPNSAEAHGWLGQLYFGAGRVLEAQRETEKTIQLSPQDVRPRVNAGIIYAAQNRADLAEQSFKSAVELNPAIPQPYVLLCQLYWMQNRQIEFNVNFQTLVRLAPPVAQNLQMQLQMWQAQFQTQPRVNPQAVMQAQWASWLQSQPQNSAAQAWPPMQSAQPNRDATFQKISTMWDKDLHGDQA